MNALQQMYQAAILEHARSQKYRGTLDPADVKQEGVNPSCGDELTLTLNLDGDRVREARISGHGCAVSQASASLMAAAIEGKTLAEVETLIAQVKAMLHGEGADPNLGELAVLEGVKRLPARIKCAVLAWTTLETGLAQRPG